MTSSTATLRVAVDATSLIGPRTGVGQVTAGLLDALAQRTDIDPAPFAVTWRGRHRLAAALPPPLTAHTRPLSARLARVLWERLGRPQVEHWTGPVDVVHAPNYVAPPAHAPVVATVHDLTFLRFPELCTPDTLTYPRHLRRALAAGATLHAVSDFVADEARAALDIDPDRVVPIYFGVTPSAGGDAAAGSRLTGTRRYVLALGTLEPRKNLPRLVAAFDAVASRHADTHLVVVGPDGWGAGAFDQAVASSRHPDRVRRLGYVGDTDRRDLLAGATLLAYPSLYEGFGHPPLEAMQAGVPVVAASAGALPEVLGDAALLPDPTDVDAIAAALEQVLADDEQRATLVAKGRERAARYTWDRAGTEMAALYRRLADTR